MVALESVQNNEMVHVPVNDAGKLAALLKIFGTHAVSFDVESVMLGGKVDILGLGTVS